MKRGVAYTIVSLVLLLVVATLFYSQQRARDDGAAEMERVRAIDSFLVNLEEDSQRAARIAGYRSLIAMEQHVTSTGEFLADPATEFREAFLEGSIAGANYTIMENSTFGLYLQRVRQDAARRGIEANITVINISLWHADPWHVRINYTLRLNVSDARGSASWLTITQFLGTIPITDLRDPLYGVYTFGRIQRVVRETNVTQFVDDAGDANDTTQLLSHFNNSFYIAQGRGPDFLMRFAGNLSSSPFGIESLVDVEEISAQGLAVYGDRTIVDYKYFSGVAASTCSVQNLPSRMKFETQSRTVYEIEGELTYAACP